MQEDVEMTTGEYLGGVKRCGRVEIVLNEGNQATARPIMTTLKQEEP